MWECELISEGIFGWQVLELEDDLTRLSVIHVAGTKGKVRRLVRFDKRPDSLMTMEMESLIIFALVFGVIDKGAPCSLENYIRLWNG